MYFLRVQGKDILDFLWFVIIFGVSFSVHFLKNMDFMANGGTSILWDPTVFWCYFDGFDPSGKHNEWKTVPSKMKSLWEMKKTVPSRIFQHCRSNLDTTLDNILQFVCHRFWNHKKSKRSESRVLARWHHPGPIEEEGGTRKQPGGTHLRFSPLVWDKTY